MFCRVCFLSLLLTHPLTADELQRHLETLRSGKEQDARLAAVKWLGKQREEPARARALQALEHCVRQDRDVDVRLQAIQAVGMLALQQKPLLAPQALIDVLLDPDPEVRSIAMTCCALVKGQTFPPEAIPILLRVARHEDPNTRADGLFALARTAPKDQRARQTLIEARKDGHDYVRFSARLAWLNYVEDELGERVRFYVSTLAEATQLNEKAGTSEQELRDKARRNLSVLGMLFKLEELLAKSPDDLSRVFHSLLQDSSAPTRAATARLLARLAALEQARSQQQSSPIIPFTEPPDQSPLIPLTPRTYLPPPIPLTPPTSQPPPVEPATDFSRYGSYFKLPQIREGTSNTVLHGEGGKRSPKTVPPVERARAEIKPSAGRLDRAVARPGPGTLIIAETKPIVEAKRVTFLKRLNVESLLRKLKKHDPDADVRKAASEALLAMQVE